MNSRLLNVPAILVAVLTVSIGMFVYNTSQSTISDSFSTISTQEIEAFNNQFTSYEGAITGSNVKALMGRLIANASTYEDEIEKIPGIVFEQLNEEEFIEQTVVDPFENENDYSNYITSLGTCRNIVETKHTYYVEITYQDTGLIDYIHISYDESNPITNLKYR